MDYKKDTKNQAENRIYTSEILFLAWFDYYSLDVLFSKCPFLVVLQDSL